MSKSGSSLSTFFEELKRRKVFHIAAVYLTVGWILIQIAQAVFPLLHLPSWSVTLVLVLLIIGFPISLIFAWAIELAPSGVKRTKFLESKVKWKKLTTTFSILTKTEDVKSYLFQLTEKSNNQTPIDRTWPEKIFQTHIKSGSIPPATDIIRHYLKVDPEHRPLVERLIVISSPLDIEFAAHSLQLAEEYGESINVYITFEELEKLPAYPNFTLIHWSNDPHGEVLLTFPVLQDPLFRANYDDHTSGLVFKERMIYKAVERFLQMSRNLIKNQLGDKTQSQILDYSKRLLWETKRREYCRAIAFSVKNAILYDEALNKNVLYIGLVGSVRIGSKDDNPGDVDIVIIVNEDNISLNFFKRLKRSFQKVLERYNCDTVLFKDVWEASPVKLVTNEGEQSISREIFPVHVLLNTKDTVRRWSRFIGWHRLHNKEDLVGSFPEDLVHREFSAKDLLSGVYGIDSLIMSLEKDEVESQMWIADGDTLKKKDRSIKIQNPAVKLDFFRYSVKWTTHNIYAASDVDLIWEDEMNEVAALDALSQILGLNSTTRKVLIEVIDRSACSEISAINLSQWQAAAKEFLIAAGAFLRKYFG